MIGDITEVEDGQTLRFGLCIIGAGAAGIAIARELIGTKIDIILLEGGGFDFEEEVQDLYVGQSIGVHYEPLDTVRLRYFGGSTNHWGGQSFNLDPLDFDERAWVPFSSWPISHSEFARYLPRAQQLCRLGAAPLSWEYWSTRPGVPQFPLDQARFETAVHRFPEPIPRLGEVYREDIRRAENVKCLLHVNVLRLSTDASGRTVTHAEVGSFQDRRVRITADQFVLATGGIENCRLLLVSGDPGGKGLGNQHDVVGRYFMEHASYDSGEVELADPAGARFLSSPYFESEGYSLRAEFKLRPEAQKAEQILNHSAFLRPIKRSQAGDGGTIERLVRFWNRLENRLARLLYGSETFMLRVRVEQAPNPESRVSLAAETDRFGLPQGAIAVEVWRSGSTDYRDSPGAVRKRAGARGSGANAHHV
jgi:choline dehydrogenase-like flavoprotein